MSADRLEVVADTSSTPPGERVTPGGTLTAVLAIAAILTLSPAVVAGESSAWPVTIRVFRMHRRGSSTPARIQVVDLDTYVGRVLQSGAMPPNRPIEALKAMAVVVATRAVWLIRHPDRRMTWHGRRFDITDGSRPAWCGTCDHGQLYHAVRVHSRIRRAVAAVHGFLLRRPDGRLRKPQWTGWSPPCGVAVKGNQLPAMGAVSCVRRGYAWRRVLAVYFQGEIR